jgi:hypothetical protein
MTWQEQRILEALKHSLYRALAFCSLGIGTMMIGLSFDLARAFGAGAILTALVVCTLLLKASTARQRNFRRTEAYLLLDRNTGLEPQEAQALFGVIAQRLYMRAAGFCAAAAAAMSLLALLA